MSTATPPPRPPLPGVLLQMQGVGGADSTPNRSRPLSGDFGSSTEFESDTSIRRRSYSASCHPKPLRTTQPPPSHPSPTHPASQSPPTQTPSPSHAKPKPLRPPPPTRPPLPQRANSLPRRFHTTTAGGQTGRPYSKSSENVYRFRGSSSRDSGDEKLEQNGDRKPEQNGDGSLEWNGDKESQHIGTGTVKEGSVLQAQAGRLEGTASSSSRSSGVDSIGSTSSPHHDGTVSPPAKPPRKKGPRKKEQDKTSRPIHSPVGRSEEEGSVSHEEEDLRSEKSDSQRELSRKDPGEQADLLVLEAKTPETTPVCGGESENQPTTQTSVQQGQPQPVVNKPVEEPAPKPVIPPRPYRPPRPFPPPSQRGPRKSPPKPLDVSSPQHQGASSQTLEGKQVMNGGQSSHDRPPEPLGKTVSVENEAMGVPVEGIQVEEGGGGAEGGKEKGRSYQSKTLFEINESEEQDQLSPLESSPVSRRKKLMKSMKNSFRSLRISRKHQTEEDSRPRAKSESHTASQRVEGGGGLSSAEILKRYPDPLPEGVVSPLVVKCVAYLNRDEVLKEVGLFRIPGDVSAIRRLREQFVKGADVHLGEVLDPHTVTGLLKVHFREQRISLIPRGQPLAEIVQGVKARDVETVCTVLSRIDVSHIATLRMVTELFARVIANSEQNQMTSGNLSTSCGPSMFPYLPPSSANSVLKFLVDHCMEIFQQ